MKQVRFSEVQVGQKFKYSPTATLAMVRIEPRSHNFANQGACRRCGTPKESWVNTESADGRQGGHTCPERVIYLVEEEAPASEKAPGLERVRGQIEKILRQKKLSFETKSDGQFWIRQGSTLVTISLSEWNNRVLVLLSAPVALYVKKVTLELTYLLLEKSGKAMLGGYFMTDDAIWFGHTMFGEPLNEDAFLVTLAAVGMMADQQDDEIAAMAEGQRAADAWFK
jgi:hypothetical protein